MIEIENTSWRNKLSIIKDLIMIAIPLILFMIVMNKVSDVSNSVDDIVVEQSESIEAIRLEAMNDIQVLVGQEIYVPRLPPWTASSHLQQLKNPILLMQ